MPIDGTSATLPDLIDRVRAGSVDAFAELFQQYAPVVHRVAWRMLRVPADADDVVQEVFLGLPRALRGYRGEGSLEGWIKRVAVRTCLMRMRSHRRRREEALDVRADMPTPSSTHDVIDRVALERALARIPEPNRIVFLLKVVEGYNHDEIAALLDITEDASRARLARARSELRSLLSR